jgi:hypothetical protein
MTDVVAVVPLWFNVDRIAGNQPQRHHGHDASRETLTAAIDDAFTWILRRSIVYGK